MRNFAFAYTAAWLANRQIIPSQSIHDDDGMAIDIGCEAHLGRGVKDRGRIVREADISDAILSAVDALRGLPGEGIIQPD